MLLSPCGIDCEVCHLKDGCEGGCLGIEGKPFYLKDFGVDVCPMYDCAVNKHKFAHCGECEELPCKIHYDWKDPSMTDDEHLEGIKTRVNILKGSE